MTKFRSRLLVSLVLAAVALAAVGIDVASASTARHTGPPWRASTTAPRPNSGPFAGEPDPSGSGAPIPLIKPASLTPMPAMWMAQLWIQWRIRSQFSQHRSGR
jgi:hypothetical protein